MQPYAATIAPGWASLTEAVNAAGASVDLPDFLGETALMAACCRGGHAGVVRTLIRERAQVNLQSDYGETALTLAAAAGCLETVRELIKGHAQVDLQGKSGFPLSCAIVHGHLAVIQELLGANARSTMLDHSWWPALVDSTLMHRTDVLPVIIAAKKKKDSLDRQDEDGRTALMNAASNMFSAVHQFIESGSDIGLQDNEGRTALMYAVKEECDEPRRFEIVRKLAAASAVDLQDNSGRSALIQACDDGNLGAVQELVGAGARLDLADHAGRTALAIARTALKEKRREHSAAIVSVLEEAGATELGDGCTTKVEKRQQRFRRR
ncbi:hypothetical protein DIPPA_03933 [Diplonema papillatum]|nr:hypothetical protein DIPPA_03933 [Diplonema papillatum]